MLLRFLHYRWRGRDKLAIRVSVLGSSSKGNSMLVETPRCKLLFDVGFSAKETERRLGLLGVEANQIDAVLVSHEHTDHIRGLSVLARRYGMQIYSNATTLAHSENRLKVKLETSSP